MIDRKINFMLIDANKDGLVFGLSFIDDPKGVQMFGIDNKQCVNVTAQDFKLNFFQKFDKAVKTLQKANPIVRTKPSLLTPVSGSA